MIINAITPATVRPTISAMSIGEAKDEYFGDPCGITAGNDCRNPNATESHKHYLSVKV